MPMHHQAHAKIFKAFCDANRLHILEMLRDGEKCACDLLENLEIGQSSLSYHMKILTESGVVCSRPVGKWTYYHIDEKGASVARAVLGELTNIGNDSLRGNEGCP